MCNTSDTMASPEERTKEKVKIAHEAILQLGQRAVEMALIDRAVYLTPERMENDAEHSFHLGLTAMELAEIFYPKLDSGLVAKYSLVHDLIETITGDVPTYNLTKSELEEKRQTEHDALPQLRQKLPEHTRKVLDEYEEQKIPEARFVRVVDKLLPAIIHTILPEANKEEFFRRFGIKDEEHLAQLSAARTRALKADYPEFDLIHQLRTVSSAMARRKLLAIGQELT